MKIAYVMRRFVDGDDQEQETLMSGGSWKPGKILPKDGARSFSGVWPPSVMAEGRADHFFFPIFIRPKSEVYAVECKNRCAEKHYKDKDGECFGEAGPFLQPILMTKAEAEKLASASLGWKVVHIKKNEKK